jgi:hypothetical protein
MAVAGLLETDVGHQGIAEAFAAGGVFSLSAF